MGSISKASNPTLWTDDPSYSLTGPDAYDFREGILHPILASAPMRIGSRDVCPTLQKDDVELNLEGITTRLALYQELGKKWEWFDYLMNQLANLYHL